MTASAQLEALGTGISVSVTDDPALPVALAVVQEELARVDLACSRFRADSELTRLNRLAGEWVAVSPLLMSALEVSLRAATLTDGLVDPTIGKALIAAGYDDDFARVPKDGPAIAVRPQPAIGFHQLRLDQEAGRAWIPWNVALDLGSTAKALAADRAASTVASITGQGALVSCGGDVASAGLPPTDGWPVQVSAHHADPFDGEAEMIAIHEGGVATSGTVARRWQRGEREWHHIIDPRTGLPAETPWKLVTVAAGTCVDANIASTAAIILGDDAPSWLEERGLVARLVRHDGSVVRVGNWPA